MDDDLDGEGGVEVGLGDGGGVVVVQHLREVAVVPASRRPHLCLYSVAHPIVHGDFIICCFRTCDSCSGST